MVKGYAVIGANYGDEGKGLITDYLASTCTEPDRCLVVRYNGGAQAGHTVVAPDGRRHVFSHFGAGSFCGSSTYLSRFFIVNPMLFVKEFDELLSLNLRPTVYIDTCAMLTTPVDVLINQLVERHRNARRHGSCGVGINETVTRCLRSPNLTTRAGDMERLNELASKIRELSGSWLSDRLRYFGIDESSQLWHFVQKFRSNIDSITENYLSDCLHLRDNSILVPSPPPCSSVIFEGAQGLMLDEDRLDQWPHVTRSKTGLANIAHLTKQFDIEHLTVNYVTRTYLTRHGAGPLEGEEDLALKDATNSPNEYQGTLRFAKLNPKVLEDSIHRDVSAYASNLNCSYSINLAVSCMDQMPLQGQLCLPIQYMSTGATRLHVEELPRQNSRPVGHLHRDMKASGLVYAR